MVNQIKANANRIGRLAAYVAVCFAIAVVSISTITVVGSPEPNRVETDKNGRSVENAFFGLPAAERSFGGPAQSCLQSRAGSGAAGSDNRFRLRGTVYDKADRIVSRVTVKISSPQYSCSLRTGGRFLVYLPRGRYNFEISDGNGGPGVFSRINVVSDTSINFILASRPAIAARPAATLSASRTSIKKGESVTLSWTTENATGVKLNAGIGSVRSRGSQTVTPSSTTIYELTASNSSGTISKSVAVTVTGSVSQSPTATLKTSARTVKKGESATISWTTGNADSVKINQGIGIVGSRGSRTVSPSSTTTYQLTASNSTGTVTRQITVGVAGTPATPTPNTSPATPTAATEPDRPNPVQETTVVPPTASKTPTVVERTPEPLIGTRNPTPTPTSATGPGSGVPYLGLISAGILILALAALTWYFWPALIAALPWAAGLLSGLGVAAKATSKEDEVHCTLYSPSEVSAGTDHLIQVFAHLLEQEGDLAELAHELEPAAKKQLSKRLKRAVKRKSVLTFKLMVPGIELDEAEQDFVWDGKPEGVEFIIPIPSDHPAGKRFGRVFVYNNGEQIGKIPFRINILPAELQLDPSAVETKIGGVMTNNETAFVSYASKDKEKVYRFVQLLDVLRYEYHIDIFHIDAGERWEQKLYEFIDRDEIFLLFWSEAASQSEWVIKEARLAKERTDSDKKGLPRIIIYKLDGQVEVPDWLKDIQVDRKWAEIIGSIETRQGIAGPKIG